jgi:protein-S-isoprenylcysteine O-methyltransferase Ste14
LCKQEGNATFSCTIDSLEPPLPDYAVFIVRCILFGVAHSLFAAKRTKQTFSRVAGSELRAYRLIYNLASLAMFGWVMTAYRTSPLLYAAHGIWRWVLYAAQLVVATVIFRCIRQTGTGDFLGISQLRSASTPPRKLATSGWYARVRHPLYLYSTLFLVMNPVMTAQWLLLTIFSIAYFIVGGMFEERRLLKEFGDEYDRYRQRVPFMIPSTSNREHETRNR